MPSDVSKESLHARGWAAHEFATAELGDKRLVKRLERIATDFAEHPGAAIPQACGDAHQAKAAYRFFDNDAFEPGQILAAHTRATSQRMRAHAVVLAVQDTTYLNYSNRPATEGLGPIGNNLDKTKGLILHSTLALTPKGEPLGVIDARIQARSKEHFGRTGNQRNRTPLAEKESIKWLESYAACEALAAQCPGITVVSLGDREMDLYELYVARHQARGAWPVELLVRSQHNRQLADSEQLLWDRVQEQPVCARIEVKMPARDGQPARVAQVAIRFAPVTLQPPDLKSEQPPLPVWIVQASEEHPPENAKPLLWRLLTTVPVLCPEDAICRVRWYAQRWQIEVMHKVLKSGCRIEERQLESAARLKRALMVDLVVAWRIMSLGKAARETPQAPASAWLSEEEWRALTCYFSAQRTPATEPPGVRQAVRWIAQLGGFLGRARDGEPGPIVLWRGLQQLRAITAAWTRFGPQKCG